MKRLYLFVLFCLLSASPVLAQVFGNEWINYSQRYLKIKIAADGLYRLDSTVLSNSLNAIGVPLSTINPRNFQLFHNGAEQYIWVEGEGDNTFNSSDYIEFFGQRNDGAADSALYGGSAKQLNPYFSLYNDTAVYFLTWNNSVSNLRMANGTDTTFSLYTPSNYFTNREVFFGSNSYLPGVEDPLGITDPDFIPSEGWYDGQIFYGQSIYHYINTANAYAAGQDGKLFVKIGSLSNDWSLTNDNDVRIQYLSNTFDTLYDGYVVAGYNFDIPASQLTSSIMQVTVSSINPGSSVSSGRTAIAYITFTYQHTFDMENRNRFNGFLPDNSNGPKSLMQMTNIGGSGAVRVYDFFHHRRIDAVYDNTLLAWKALVQNGNGTEKPFMVASESNVTNISSLDPVNTNGTFTDYPSQATDSAFVIVSHASLWGVAQNYKNYRSSAAGGFHNVILADVNELYDQFGWGIGGSPLAIRRFSDYMIQNYPSKPGHLLLLGKSFYSDISRSSYYSQNLVPTMGYPPCDNLITAHLADTLWRPSIPTGRIAARSPTEAQWYLDKVIDYENNTPAEWMKYVLHFGGGTSVGEQMLYANYLQNYENIIEDTLFGGIVETYLKTSSAPIQINQSDSLRERIESGVSIMTFFGHASGTGFDQSIDDPSTYNNQGKYPLLIANSCYAGDIHSTGVSSSEAFTLLNQKGTIGYIASVGAGLPGFLDIYSSRLYNAIGRVQYGNSIGECMQWTIGNAQTTAPQSLQLKSTCFEMTLQGDPAIVINSFPQPDYEITNSSVWFDQESQPDSITIFAGITNLGRAINDTFIVRMQRKFPNGDTIVYLKQIGAPKFKDTISFKIPVDVQRGPGLNHFRIDIDYFSQIFEMREDNNSTQPDVDLLIRGSAIVPVYPYEFAVIPTDTITLRASTVNALEPLKQYRFELDTIDTYDSPFKQSFVIIAPGGVVSWKPILLSTDSMVYFWRVSPDSLSSSDALVWRESSFQFINGKTGWGQDHIFQFKNDKYQYAKLLRPSREFVFVNDIKSLIAKNGVYEAWWLNDSTGIPWNESWYKINGATQHIFSCEAGVGSNGITIAVIDPVSGVPWNYTNPNFGTQPDGYYNCVPGQTMNAYDFFDIDSVNCNYIRDYLNSIPNGYRVLLYSQHYYQYHHYPYSPSLLNAFQNIGSSTLASGTVPDTASFIVWGTKGGFAGSANEVIGLDPHQSILLQDTISTNWNEGFIASPVIGPAVAWGSFHWKQHEVEGPDYDSVYVELRGITANGVETTITNFPEDSTDINNLNLHVNASMYPYIRLIVHMKDDTNRTPPQMERWHVLYTPYPDAAVNPPLAFSFYNDTVQEGETAKLIVGIQNVTPWAFTDSLLISSWLIDNNGVKHNLPQQLRAPSFNGYAWFADTLNVNTTGYAGMNQLWLEVNPTGNVNSQLEQYHFNNVLMLSLMVGADEVNPLLDVTFDGIHIMDGDIVSAKPSILISLKDENQFLALNDTSDFNVFLRKPSQSIATLIPWGPQMIFTPAVLPNNSCKIQYLPDCIEDGTYDLIVQAKDRSNNQSGFIDYKISFEVVNKPSVTNVLNYPNPFTSSTQFVFTLTGSEVPQLFTIQIMTITGKVVREIDVNELGGIHIGRNITPYAWDGRDEYGDQLANGVYLYRVITRLNNQEVEHRESGADPYIVQGWGKMYLMR